jgi:hypothetical protein
MLFSSSSESMETEVVVAGVAGKVASTTFVTVVFLFERGGGRGVDSISAAFRFRVVGDVLKGI